MKNKILSFFKKKNKSKKGISLVEVIVALTIVSIVLAGVTSGLSFSYNTILKDGMVDTASSAAQDMIDTIAHSLKDQHQNVANAPYSYITGSISPELSYNGIGSAYSDPVVFVTPGASFPAAYNGTNGRQFTIEKKTVDGIKGFLVKVAVYYNTNGTMSFIQQENFVAGAK